MKRRYVAGGLAVLLGLGHSAGAAGDAVVPPIVVTGSVLKEEKAVGPYQQPEWTLSRRFPTTRVFVQQPPGGFAVGQWVRSRFDNGNATHLMQEEVEIGLPHRLQLDLYENWEIDQDGNSSHDNVAAEVRWALADWGRLPLNPTVYLEYKFVDEDRGEDVFEGKLLFGEELGPAWHWGLNLVYERELGGEKAEELALSQGLSYVLLDGRVSVGAEMKYAEESVEGERGDPERKLLLGPSVQWRPTENTHLDVVPLIGLTDEAPDVESYVVFGVEFGPGNRKARAPVSLQSD